MKRSSVLVVAAVAALAATSIVGAAGCGSCPPRVVCPKTDAAGPSPVVATVAGTTITLAEVDRAAALELHEARKNALEKMVTDRALAADAKKAGLSVDEYVKHEMELKIPEVSDAEAAEFFKENKEQLPPDLADKPFAAVRPIIVRGLTSKKRGEAAAGFLEARRRAADVQISLEPPRVEVAATGPSRGPEHARVTIVEFSDFQCPYCSRGREVVEQVLRAYPSDVRVVFRDFPLPFHENAMAAAEAGQCANEQGKFWPMHDWMFAHQKDLDEKGLKEGARAVGLEAGRFAACLATHRYAAAVEANVKAAEAVGVNGTPAFFINGVMLSGAQPFSSFKTEIDRALK